MQLIDAIEEFLSYLVVERNRSDETQKGYRKDLNRFTAFLQEQCLAEMALEELSYPVLSSYVRYLSEERKLQPATVRRHVTTMKSFGNFLENNDYLPANPAEELVMPRKSQKKPRYLHKKEVDKLFDAVPENGSSSMLRDKTVLMFLYYTGVRVSELVQLQTCQLDLENGFARIIKGKGSRYRKVPLHHKLQDQLQCYLDKAPELSNGYLFCNKKGKPVTTDYVHDMVVKKAQKAGLNKEVTPHTLRHTFATHLYRKNTDLFVLGKLLGHAELQNTTIYTHTDIEHLREAVITLQVSPVVEAQLIQLEGSNHES